VIVRLLREPARLGLAAAFIVLSVLTVVVLTAR
jgi:hypothetical protein